MSIKVRSIEDGKWPLPVFIFVWCGRCHVPFTLSLRAFSSHHFTAGRQDELLIRTSSSQQETKNENALPHFDNHNSTAAKAIFNSVCTPEKLLETHHFLNPKAWESRRQIGQIIENSANGQDKAFQSRVHPPRLWLTKNLIKCDTEPSNPKYVLQAAKFRQTECAHTQHQPQTRPLF